MNNSLESVQGRVVKLFNHGKIILFQLATSAKKISALISKKNTLEYAALCQQIKLGSYIRGNGYWQKGRRTEHEFVFLCIDYIAENSLSKNETGFMTDSSFSIDLLKKRYHTYLCLDDVCATHIACKGKMMYAIRRTLDERGYLEVNTPVFTKNFYAGGAQPFITHMLDNGSDMYMRITSEFALKMVIGGGFSRVYEIGPSFRNGSVNKKYLTPFTAAEIYTAFLSEEKNIELAESIIRCVENEITPIIEECGMKKKVSFLGEIPKISFDDYYFSKTGERFDWNNYMNDPSKYRNQSNDIYKLLKNELFSYQVSPVFVTDLPSGNSPLIACKSKKTLYRSYLVVNGATLMEIAIGESDPKRFLDKINSQNLSDQHKRDYSNFVHAFQMGMPPIASLFIGVDRVIPAFLGIDNLNDLSMTL